LPQIALAPGNSVEWDGRFRVAADAKIPTPLVVAPLGRSGFAKLRQQLERAPRLPARAAATLPAFWQDDRLVAVPTLAGLPWSPAAWGAQARLCSAEFLW
jgi:tRNA(Ile)-lysidine synthase